MESSPIFDGSDTSMSGNGEFIPNKPDVALTSADGTPALYLPPGTGGGCVTSGPFRNMTVNLGPIHLDTAGDGVGTIPDGPFGYHPRCLKRDLTSVINLRFANATSILSTVAIPRDIDTFQMRLQGIPGDPDIGVHAGAHFALGGDPGRDFYVSPGDPAFYLHHSMIDRTWWLWQWQSPNDRQSGPGALAGTNTLLNDPPSANTTMDDFVDIGNAGGPSRRIGELLSTVQGPFCYVYE